LQSRSDQDELKALPSRQQQLTASAPIEEFAIVLDQVVESRTSARSSSNRSSLDAFQIRCEVGHGRRPYLNPMALDV
jgi:hypothetical protein